MTEPQASWLRDLPPLMRLADPAWRHARERAHMVCVPAGAMIFRAGDPCQSYLLVRSGTIRVHKPSASGKEIVLYRVAPGESRVLTTACLFVERPYPAAGVAESAVCAVALPQASFREALAQREGFRRFVFASFGSRLAELMLLIEEVAFARMDGRLAARLLALADESGRVALTHQQLALELGTAREVVSRLLKEFERHGWLRRARGRIDITERASLARLAGSLPR